MRRKSTAKKPARKKKAAEPESTEKRWPSIREGIYKRGKDGKLFGDDLSSDS